MALYLVNSSSSHLTIEYVTIPRTRSSTTVLRVVRSDLSFFPLHPPHTTISSPVAVSPVPHSRVTDQPEVEGSAGEERSSQKPWWKRIPWEAHEGNKRRTPLGEAPSVSQSLRAIVKLSCKHLPSVALPFLDGRWSDLGSNVLLIFIPLSVSVSYHDLARQT